MKILNRDRISWVGFKIYRYAHCIYNGLPGRSSSVYTHMRNNIGLPDLSMDVDHQRLFSHSQLYDWPFWVYPQPRLTCMTNCSAGYLTRGHLYLTCRSLCIPVKANITNSSEANQCLLKLKLLTLHGDTYTPLYMYLSDSLTKWNDYNHVIYPQFKNKYF